MILKNIKKTPIRPACWLAVVSRMQGLGTGFPQDKSLSLLVGPISGPTLGRVCSHTYDTCSHKAGVRTSPSDPTVGRPTRRKRAHWRRHVALVG